MADEWQETGGLPQSVALHATTRDGSDDPEFSRQVMCDDLGALAFFAPDPIAVNATIVAPDPIPVDTEDRIVQTNETLYSSWTAYDIQVMATGSLTTGVALTAHAATGGFLVIAAPDNTGTVYIGHDAAHCFIPLPQGTPYSVSLANTNQAYFRAVEDGDGVYVVVYTL